MIRPEGTGDPSPITAEKVFVYQGELSDLSSTMLNKMVTALKYASQSVCILAGSEAVLAELQTFSSPLRIVFFGETFPGRFGEALNWAGHQIVKTHDLTLLVEQPNLKGQTWNHLKLFAGLK